MDSTVKWSHLDFFIYFFTRLHSALTANKHVEHTANVERSRGHRTRGTLCVRFCGCVWSAQLSLSSCSPKPLSIMWLKASHSGGASGPVPSVWLVGASDWWREGGALWCWGSTDRISAGRGAWRQGEPVRTSAAFSRTETKEMQVCFFVFHLLITLHTFIKTTKDYNLTISVKNKQNKNKSSYVQPISKQVTGYCTVFFFYRYQDNSLASISCVNMKWKVDYIASPYVQ